jgi:predicted TIM-barrel fold metal-dependent hydrolase
MLKNGWRVADSDMHVMEPPDLWQRYIDPAWRHAAPVGLTELRRDMRVRLKSHILLRLGPVRPMDDKASKVWKTSQDDVYGRAEAQGWNPASQLQAMDAEGLDRCVLFPSRGLFVLGLDTPQMMGADGLEPALAAAIARAYNDWMRDFCRADPVRLLGAGMVAPHDVAAATAEARRCVEQLGFKAIFLAPGCVNRRPWHDAAYDPLWAECERLGVTVCFHGGGQTYLRPDFSLEVLDKLMMWHVFNQPLAMMTVAVSLTAGGVFERFPALRVGLLEGNCTWAPWLLHRLDEHYEWVGGLEAPDLKMKPSEYFRRNCFLSVEADEKTIGHYIEYLGDDNLVFSTDYPHADSKFPHSVEEFLELPVSEKSKRRILWDNWCRLYGLNG